MGGSPDDDGFTFNGSDNYATMAAFTSLGTPATYTEITYDTTNDDGYIIDSAEPISEFGRVGANYHDGSLKNLLIKDSAPIQNRTVMIGDRTRFLTLNNGITLGTSDFEIEFSFRRQDTATTTSTQRVLGAADGTTRIEVNDTAHATFPNRISMTIPGASLAAWNASIAGVAVGKQCALKFVCVSNTVELFVDGVTAGTKSLAGRTSMTIETIYKATSNAMAINGVMANLRIENTTSGLQWFYPLTKVTV